MDTGFRIRLSDLSLSENGDAKYWYRGAQMKMRKIRVDNQPLLEEIK